MLIYGHIHGTFMTHYIHVIMEGNGSYMWMMLGEWTPGLYCTRQKGAVQFRLWIGTIWTWIGLDQIQDLGIKLGHDNFSSLHKCDHINIYPLDPAADGDQMFATSYIDDAIIPDILTEQ